MRPVKLYHIFLLIYIIGGSAAIVLSLTKGFNREQIGLALLMGSILPIFVINNLSLQNSTSTGIRSKYLFKITVIIWLFVFIFSILPLLDSLKNYYLSLTYFLSICLLSLIISYQILASSKLTKFQIFTILVEILFLALYLSVSLIFLFPAPIGNDAVSHTEFISSIFSSGNLNSYSIANQYVNYPVYHLTFASLMILSDIDIRITQVVLAFAQIFAVLFVFIICDKIFNEKIALLSTLLITLSSQMIMPRYSFYPSNYSIVYYMLFLFVLFCFQDKKSSIWPIMLIVLIVVNFIHPVLSFIIAFTSIFIYILSKLFRFNKIIDIRYILLSVFLMLLQYVRPIGNNMSLLSSVIPLLQGTMSRSVSVTQATLSPFLNWIDVLLYDMGFTLLIGLGVSSAILVLITCDYVKFNIKDKKEYRTILSSITLVLIPIPYVLAIVSPNFLPDRWFVYITIFIGTFSAIGIYLFSELFKKILYVALIVLQLVIFFSITSPVCNPNNHIYSEDLSSMPSITESEMSAAGFFKSNVDLDKVCANSLYIGRIDNELGTKDHYIYPNKMYPDMVMIIRNYDIDKGFTVPLYGENGKLLEKMKPTSYFLEYINDTNKFYDNGNVRAFIG